MSVADHGRVRIEQRKVLFLIDDLSDRILLQLRHQALLLHVVRQALLVSVLTGLVILGGLNDRFDVDASLGVISQSLLTSFDETLNRVMRLVKPRIHHLPILDVDHRVSK